MFLLPQKRKCECGTSETTRWNIKMICECKKLGCEGTYYVDYISYKIVGFFQVFSFFIIKSILSYHKIKTNISITNVHINV